MSQPARTPEVQIVWDPSVKPFLTAGMGQTLYALLPVLEQMAAEDPAPVAKIEIRGYVDPEEGWKEVEVRSGARSHHGSRAHSCAGQAGWQ